jgi:hypothetical protein
MRDFYEGSIYDKISSSKNWITSDWDRYKEKYKSGYSSSSCWLDFDEGDQVKTKQDLNFALVQVCRSVNLIRHKFGIGEKKALIVKWADEEKYYNSADNEYVYLCPSPLISRSDLSIKQRYDVIVGQALLSSVQKHIIPARLYEFLNKMKYRSDNIPEMGIDILIDNESILLSSGDVKIIYSPEFQKYDRVNRVPITVRSEVTGIPYEKRNGFYRYSNLNVSMFMEWHNIWRAIEQDITEKALSNEYKGSSSYLFAHRNFYLDKKYSAILQETVQYFDLEWMPKIWHLLIINNILNQDKITKVHPVYETIMNMANETLVTDALQKSETRFASTVELMGRVSEFLEELKTEKISLNPDITDGSNDTKSQEKPMPESLKKKLNKIVSEISKSGLGEGLAKFSNIIEKKSHKNLVKNTEEFDVSDENKIKFFELETMSIGMMPVDAMQRYYFSHRGKAVYDEIAGKNKQYIDFLKESLLIRSFDFNAEEYSMKSGSLDENSLWKMMFDNHESENIFYQKTMPKTSDNVYITLVFDNSGSMANTRVLKNKPPIQICNEIAVILKEVTDSLTNVKFDVCSFSDINFMIYDKDPYCIAIQQPVGGTAEGKAIALATHRIETFKHENPDVYYDKRYLIFVGDGLTDMKEVINSLEVVRKSTDIKFFHIGINEAYDNDFGVRTYGKGNFAIIPSENLMHNLCMSIVKILS